jgi:membrane protein
MAAEEASWLAMGKEAVSDFMEDGCMRMAAALSYYTVFALPPLLILILMIVGFFFDPATVQEALRTQFGGLVGAEGAEQIATIIQEANRPDTGGPLAAILGIGALILGATGAFVELQAALNRAWDVEPDPEAGGIWSFITKRLLSFGMVLALAFLLLVSLALSAMLAAFGGALAALLPGGASDVLLQILNLVVSFVVISLLFAAMFKLLPDAKVAWRDVWVGAMVTALLFVVGKFLIGLYLGRSDPGSAFGAAGSLAILLVWIYYSALIVFLGAEFTQVWAEHRGTGVEPEKGAVRIEESKRVVEGGSPERKQRKGR